MKEQKIKNLFYDENYGYRHRPWWKVVINTILRFFQPFMEYRWVIASEITQDENGNLSRVVGYRMVKAKHSSRGEMQ